jgi:hypothetical protein
VGCHCILFSLPNSVFSLEQGTSTMIMIVDVSLSMVTMSGWTAYSFIAVSSGQCWVGGKGCGQDCWATSCCVLSSWYPPPQLPSQDTPHLFLLFHSHPDPAGFQCLGGAPQLDSGNLSTPLLRSRGPKASLALGR